MKFNELASSMSDRLSNHSFAVELVVPGRTPVHG